MNEIKPVLMERYCGGWLAVSPRYAEFRIGVTERTREAAATKFRETYAKWEALLAPPASSAVTGG